METVDRGVTAEDRIGRLRRARLTITEARTHSGVRGALRATGGLARAVVPAIREELGEIVLDVLSGTRTRGIVNNEATLRRAAAIGDAQPYEGVHLSWWRQFMAESRVTPAETIFLDLGAGRGRALMLAMQAGFRRVIGVELDPQMAASAEKNLHNSVRRRRWARRSPDDFSIIVGDAVNYPLPDGNFLLFLYNPFGAETLHRVLDRLCARPSSGESRTMIAYFNPVNAEVFEQFPSLAISVRGENWILYDRA
jgi:SAM-dependent methyltransferase